MQVVGFTVFDPQGVTVERGSISMRKTEGMSVSFDAPVSVAEGGEADGHQLAIAHGAALGCEQQAADGAGRLRDGIAQGLA